MYQIYIQNSVSCFKLKDALLLCFSSRCIVIFFLFYLNEDNGEDILILHIYLVQNSVCIFCFVTY